MRTKDLQLSSKIHVRKECIMTNTPKKRGPKPWKRKPHIIFRIGNIQLVWMRKPT